MKYSLPLAALLSMVTAHGVITSITGANGVTMPGLSVADGTPRDCATPACGSEKDTSIIRTAELGTGKASALGRTNGGGPVDIDKAISTFMGTGDSASTTTTKSTGNKSNTNKKRANGLSGLLGGKTGGGSSGSTSTGTKTAKGTTENGVAKAAGTGEMPTVDENGVVTMMFHQVNQDGAGPLTASIDSTSGGKDPSAFKDAQVTQNVPGIGIGGLSAAQTTDFPVKVQVPEGTTCSGSAGGVDNICVLRLQNSALAGPFGGSVAFVQSSAAKKRAVEYNLRRRHMARGLFGKPAA